jgi:hypothetical protein
MDSIENVLLLAGMMAVGALIVVVIGFGFLKILESMDNDYE